ncbi:MAG: ABC transporter substrate-binding protein [Gemmatimonadetes bacterium]|nr:ABC transporter substrate-binding protein [Gemmatimonadota bacterium]
MSLRCGSMRVLTPALALAASLTACTPSPPPVVRVGLIGVFEGAARASSGLPALQGAELAIAELNAEGGVEIDGRAHQLVLVSRQISNRPDAAAETARGLINLDSIDVLVGPQYSNLALTAGAVAEAAEVPMIAPMASGADVTKDRAMVTRLAFLDAVQGAVLARYVYDSLGLRRAAAMHNVASSYGREIVALFCETFEALGGTVVAVERYDADDSTAHQPQLRRIAAANPDALLLPNFTVHDSVMLHTLHDAGIRARLLGTDAWDAVAVRLGPEVYGTVIVANWDRRTNREATRQFLTTWQARYPDERVRATAVATYDAVRLLARAMSRAGVRSGRAVSDSLRRTGRFEGALATYVFDGTGNPRRGAVLLEVTPDSVQLRATMGPPG